MVLLPFGGLTSEASHDIPADPALTRWHQRNVGDGDRQHLLLDLKASEGSRGPPLTAVSRDAGGGVSERLTDEGCHHRTPQRGRRLVWPNDTSLKL